jgi:putative glutamine amidotransferase
MRPVIGITSSTATHQNFPNAPHYIGQQYTYFEAVLRAGGLPLMIPIVDDLAVLREYYAQCDGLLISGGNDITPTFYKNKIDIAEVPSDGTHYERDKQELQLWQWAESDDKPVLGICRGLQLINVACGGTLYQDIPTELPDAGTHRVKREDSTKDDYFTILHHLKIKHGSKLAAILHATEIDSNSFHHQAVNKLGKGLEIVAWAEDGVVEGLEMPGKRFVLAVQSHPEALEGKVVKDWQKLFAAFVGASRTNLLAPEQQLARPSLTH